MAEPEHPEGKRRKDIAGRAGRKGKRKNKRERAGRGWEYV
jgi:hypothetical protein